MSTNNLKKKVLLVTSEHFKLAQNLYVSFTGKDKRDDIECLGAPLIDHKRPYGNAPAYRDINKILDLGFVQDAEDEFSEKERAYMLGLHREIGMVLEIILSTKKFTPGIYETLEIADDTDLYSKKWVYVKHTGFSDKFVIGERRKILEAS